MSNYKELLAQREASDRKIEEARCGHSDHSSARQFVLHRASAVFLVDAGNKLASQKLKSVVMPTYRSPDGQTWTGRGKPTK